MLCSYILGRQNNHNSHDSNNNKSFESLNKLCRLTYGVRNVYEVTEHDIPGVVLMEPLESDNVPGSGGCYAVGFQLPLSWRKSH